MKIRFYCDLFGPLPLKDKEPNLMACTEPSTSGGPGMTRVAFDVEFPETLIREADVVVPATWVPR